MPSYKCDMDLNLFNQKFNTAYASEIGFFIHNMENECSKIGNILSYKNSRYGIISNLFSDKSYYENIITINDMTGLLLNSASQHSDSKKYLDKIMIIGFSFENNECLNAEMCIDNLCTQQGLLLSTTYSNLSNNSDIAKNFPLDNIKYDAKVPSYLIGNNIIFSKWEDICEYKSYAIRTNKFASDFTSIHEFNSFVLDRVLEDNFFYFDEPNYEWIGEKCGFLNCTGLKNILIKINEFKPSKEQQDISRIVINPKWQENSIKKYVFPNILSNINLNKNFLNEYKYEPNYYSLYVKNQISIIPNTFINKNCILIEKLNGLICSNIKFDMFLLENLEINANQSNMYIVLENQDDRFFNKINNFMDHSMDFSNSRLKKRTPVYLGLVYTNKTFDLSFPVSIPNNLKVRLADITNPSQTKNSVVFSMRYFIPQYVVFFDKNGKEIKSREWREEENLIPGDSNFKCGENRWNLKENKLDFIVTDEEDCILNIRSVNSLSITLRFNTEIDKFIANNSTFLIKSSFNELLGINNELIRVTSIIKGSTIILTEILEELPTYNRLFVNNTNNTLSKLLNLNGKLDLNKALDVIVSSIQNKNIHLPENLTELSYSLLVSNDFNSKQIFYSNIDNNQVNDTNSNTKSDMNVSNDQNENLNNNISDTFIFNGNIIKIDNTTKEKPSTNNSEEKNLKDQISKDDLSSIGESLLHIFLPMIIILILIVVICFFCYLKRKNSAKILTKSNSNKESIKNLNIIGFQKSVSLNNSTSQLFQEKKSIDNNGNKISINNQTANSKSNFMELMYIKVDKEKTNNNNVKDK